jgi:hypothetical protein
MIVGCNFYSLDEFSQHLQQTYLIQLQLLHYFILVLDTAEARNGGAITTFTLKIDKRMTANFKKFYYSRQHTLHV